jgi:pimeloyl-ACP methyl ester carboxylesterase
VLLCTAPARRPSAHLQKKLAERFDVLAPSHPGHAGSPAADWIEHMSPIWPFHYLDLLDTLGLERVHLAGASFGGWSRAEMADDGLARLDRWC